MDDSYPSWNLKEFYDSHKSNLLYKDIDRINKKAINFKEKYKNNLKNLNAQSIIRSIKEFEKLEEEIGKIKSYVYLKYCTNQLDSEIVAFYQKINEKLTSVDSHIIFFCLELNLLSEKTINKIKNSKYHVWLKNLRKFRKFQKNEEIEKILLDKNLTSSNGWIRLFDQTIAGIKFKFKNKYLGESEVLNLMSSPNSETRKLAAQSFSQGLKSNINVFSIITNTLSKDLDIDKKIRGFTHSESFRHLNNQVDKKEVDCLTETIIENYSDLSHKYYKYKAKKFKVSKLNFWDRNAPYPGQKDIKINWPEAKQLVLQAYSRFDHRIANIAEEFFKKSWIDAKVIKGKTSGAFSHPTVPSYHPFILVNFQNKLRDVMTLAHELGHGVHQYLASKQGYLLSDTPLTIAETASVFGEMLTFKSILRNCKTEIDKQIILRSKIEDMLNTVVRQISFFSFERLLHNKRMAGELTVEKINEIWMETQTTSLGPSIKLSSDYKYFWAYIPHFIHSPFYVYAYAFGDCLVNSLYAKYEEGYEDFNNKYIDLLKSGGSKHYKDLLKDFNLNPEKKKFWQNGLNIIKNMIDELEQLG